jgi:hypothetical protein
MGGVPVNTLIKVNIKNLILQIHRIRYKENKYKRLSLSRTKFEKAASGRPTGQNETKFITGKQLNCNGITLTC